MHPSLKQALLEWRSQSLYNQPGDFVFPSERLKGSKPLDLASVLNDPGLLGPRESTRNQQVSSGNDNEQAFGTRKAGERHSARGVLSASKSTLVH
jgi:hypothetical protein